LAPHTDLELDLSCPECGHSFATPFDCTAFFFSEIRARSSHLMREVHYLALHYHWSEAEILGLQRDRRRGYLALLNETLRPNCCGVIPGGELPRKHCSFSRAAIRYRQTAK